MNAEFVLKISIAADRQSGNENHRTVVAVVIGARSGTINSECLNEIFLWC